MAIVCVCAQKLGFVFRLLTLLDSEEKFADSKVLQERTLIAGDV